jgi:hypothetical protein
MEEQFKPDKAKLEKAREKSLTFLKKREKWSIVLFCLAGDLFLDQAPCGVGDIDFPRLTSEIAVSVSLDPMPKGCRLFCRIVERLALGCHRPGQ